MLSQWENIGISVMISVIPVKKNTVILRTSWRVISRSFTAAPCSAASLYSSNTTIKSCSKKAGGRMECTLTCKPKHTFAYLTQASSSKLKHNTGSYKKTLLISLWCRRITEWMWKERLAGAEWNLFAKILLFNFGIDALNKNKKTVHF